MKQHIVHDPTSAEYAGGLQAVWNQWEPALTRSEQLLHSGLAAFELDNEAGAEVLRRMQYHAHTASEFASGLRPPLAAVDAHEYLVSTLVAARDTLSVLAIRAELDELDEQTAGIGLQSLGITRDAFASARSSSTAAFCFTEGVEPIYVQPVTIEPRGIGMLLWGLIAVCVVLFTVLLFEIFLLTAPA